MGRLRLLFGAVFFAALLLLLNAGATLNGGAPPTRSGPKEMVPDAGGTREENPFNDWLMNPPIINNTDKNSFWNVTAKGQFEKGFSINCEIGDSVSGGELRVRPSKDYQRIDQTDPNILSQTVGQDGTVYCGMESGKVIAKNPFDEQTYPLFNNQSIYAGMGNITALTIDAFGSVWGACSDNGNIFKLWGYMGENRTTVPPLFPDDHYITVLQYTFPENQIWGGTGKKGYLFRIDATTLTNVTIDLFPGEYVSIDSMIHEQNLNRVFVGTGLTRQQPPPNSHTPKVLDFPPTASISSDFKSKDWALAGDGISAMTIDDRGHLFLGTRGPGQIIDYDMATFGFSVISELVISAAIVTSLYYGDMSDTIYGATGSPGKIITYDEHRGVNVMADTVPEGGTAYGNIVGTDEMMGMWINSYHNSHLISIVPVGLWISPVFNATEPAIWDKVALESKLPEGNSIIFGLMRYFDELSEMNITEFDETSFIIGDSFLDIKDTTYMQIALILQTFAPFEPDKRPILFSMNLTFDYHPQMTIELATGSDESVQNGIINYTLYLNNTSDGLADNVRATLPLPGDLQVYSASHPYTEGIGEISFTLNNVSRGANKIIDLELQVSPSAPKGTEFTLNAVLNYSGIHERYKPEITSDSVSTTVVAPHTELELVFDASQVSPGTELSGAVILNITNDMDITEAVISLPLDRNFELINSTADWTTNVDDDNNTVVVWDLGDLSRGEAHRFEFTLEVSGDAPDDHLAVFTAGAEHLDGLGVNPYQLDSAEIEVTIVKPVISFKLHRTASDIDYAELGQTISFYMEYSNNGHDSAVNVTLTAHFTDNLEDPQGSSDADRVWTIGDLKGQTVDVQTDFDLRVRTNSSDDRGRAEVNAFLTYEAAGLSGPVKLISQPVALSLKKPLIDAKLEQTDEEKKIQPGGSAQLQISWENTGDGYTKTLDMTITTDSDAVFFDSDLTRTSETVSVSNIYPATDSSRELTIYALETLDTDADLTVYVDLQYTDAYGNPYQSSQESLVVRVETNPALLEPFSVEAVFPAENATGIPVDTDIEIRFTSPVDKASLVGSAIRIEPNVAYDIVLLENNTVVKLRFTTDLAEGTEYTVTVSQDVTDTYGRNLFSNTEWTFETEDKSSGNKGGKFIIPCLLVLLLIIVAAIILAVLFIRNKRMKARLDELHGQESGEAEDADIVYAPDIETMGDKKPRVARAQVIGRKDKGMEEAKYASPVKSDDKISLDTGPGPGEPLVEAEPDVSGPSDMDELEDDLSLEDPYSVDLGLLQTPGAPGAGGKPVLALPPAVILDTEEGPGDVPYSIDEIFVMTLEGILVQHFTAKGSSTIDEDILAGMLTAVQMFIKDTFSDASGAGSALDELSLGDFKIMIGRGSYLTISAIISGEETGLVRPQLDSLVDNIEDSYQDVLEKWDGDMASVGGIQNDIKSFVEGKYR